MKVVKMESGEFRPTKLEITVQNENEAKLLTAFLYLDYFHDRYGDDMEYKNLDLGVDSTDFVTLEDCFAKLQAAVADDSIWAVEDAN